jgi:hypothetical protein
MEGARAGRLCDNTGISVPRTQSERPRSIRLTSRMSAFLKWSLSTTSVEGRLVPRSRACACLESLRQGSVFERSPSKSLHSKLFSIFAHWNRVLRSTNTFFSVYSTTAYPSKTNQVFSRRLEDKIRNVSSVAKTAGNDNAWLILSELTTLIHQHISRIRMAAAGELTGKSGFVERRSARRSP